MDEWKTRVSTQAAGQGLFIYDDVFINIYRLSYECVQFFPFIWSHCHGFLWPAWARAWYLLDTTNMSIQQTRRPAALRDAKSAQLQEKKPYAGGGLEKQLAWGLRAAPLTPSPSPVSHIQIVWLIFKRVDLGVPVSRVEKGGGGSIIHVPLLSKDD